MKIGFYAGSFDPFTVGHLHIVKSALKIFDKVIIGVGINSDKRRRYDRIKMVEAIKKLLEYENLENVEVIIYNGLSAEVAKREHNADFLIRGIRNGIDYSAEENLARINEEIMGIDTVFIRAGQYGAVSSSMVQDLIKNKVDISKYVPPFIIDLIQE